MPIIEMDYIWLNGRLVPWKDAKIHVLTHALHYGSGVFEGIRCYDTSEGPAVFRLDDHLKRLWNSAAAFFMKIPYTIGELHEAVVSLIRANKLHECYIRPIAYFGYSEMGLNPTGNPVEVAIAAWPWGAYLGDKAMSKGARAKISSYRRIPPFSLPPGAKSTGQYLNSILAKLEALRNGCDEAIMLDSRGFVAEGPGENIFIVKDGVLYTPSAKAGILLGITRDSVIKMANDLGYHVREDDVTVDMLLAADEAFFTGTATEVAPICEVDGKRVGKGIPGSITVTIQKLYKDVTKGLKKEYDHWLTHI
ncbi:MAG: branched-chain amino acid transaminase [Candidatus Bathyarchaeia archaeon]